MKKNNMIFWVIGIVVLLIFVGNQGKKEAIDIQPTTNIGWSNYLESKYNADCGVNTIVGVGTTDFRDVTETNIKFYCYYPSENFPAFEITNIVLNLQFPCSDYIMGGMNYKVEYNQPIKVYKANDGKRDIYKLCSNDNKYSIWFTHKENVDSYLNNFYGEVATTSCGWYQRLNIFSGKCETNMMMIGIIAGVGLLLLFMMRR